jgi:uncharacterized protein (TIGR02118 family)
MKIKIAIILIAACASLSVYGQQQPSAKSEDKSVMMPEKGLIKVTILYPYAEGKTFDMDYYEKSHMPFVAGLLGSNLVRYTIEKGLSNGVPNSPLPFMAIGCFYVKSLSEYQAAISPSIDAIRADFSKYTNVIPVVQVSEVVR